MKTAKCTCSLLLTCALLLLLTGSCSEAPTPPSSSAALGINYLSADPTPDSFDSLDKLCAEFARW
jgi:hypothetical protein